jgi:hypothetical protein
MTYALEVVICSFLMFSNLLNKFLIIRVDISLYLMGTYIYDDGYINNYTFYPAYYPLPSSPAGGALTSNMSISYFYDIDTTQGTDCSWNSGSIPWVNDVSVIATDSTFLGSGSNTGPNPAPNPQTIASFAGTPGTIGDNIEHWYSVDINVTVFGNQPPSPPFPPSNPVNVEYNIGSGWVQFPGSPSNFGGSFSKSALHVVNGQTLFVRVS